MNETKKILFLTGTRADFGKLKPLMLALKESSGFEIFVFVTGMHMLTKYGYTCAEVERAGFSDAYKFINQKSTDGMDQVLAKTIVGLSDYIHEIEPDLMVVHGDRVEALAGATVGALNNVLTGHIEGGEVSGTIDELIRHAVSKLSHVHFVANDLARQRLIQLGEGEKTVHVIGSPDIDVMNSCALPGLDEVRRHYEISYPSYGILIFHPVTTELNMLRDQVREMINALENSERNYVVIYPNNDHGTEIILDEYKSIQNNSHFKLFPSMRFEYFLTLLRHADFMIGNSSAGVREAPHFGVPAINLGSRQYNRVQSALVLNTPIDQDSIIDAIEQVMSISRGPERLFGNGDSVRKFCDVLGQDDFWLTSKQKHFIDRC